MAFAVLELFSSRKETVFICRQKNISSKNKQELSDYTTKAEILETFKIFMLISTCRHFKYFIIRTQ